MAGCGYGKTVAKFSLKLQHLGSKLQLRQPSEPFYRNVSQSRWSPLSLEAGARGVVRVVRVMALESLKSEAVVLLKLGTYVVNLCE